MSCQTALTINRVIKDINAKKYLLPSIQREFVWDTDQIENPNFLVDKYFYMCYYIFVRREYYMKSHSSREIIKMLKADGWYEVRIEGSHHHFKHSSKKGLVRNCM